jgi:hypothetical protein
MGTKAIVVMISAWPRGLFEKSFRMSPPNELWASRRRHRDATTRASIWPLTSLSWQPSSVRISLFPSITRSDTCLNFQPIPPTYLDLFGIHLGLQPQMSWSRKGLAAITPALPVNSVGLMNRYGPFNRFGGDLI